MLVLSRKVGQTIVIDGGIRVTVVAVEDDRVRLGIEAPREVAVWRQEIYQAIQEENRQAAGSDLDTALELVKCLEPQQ